MNKRTDADYMFVLKTGGLLLLLSLAIAFGYTMQPEKLVEELDGCHQRLNESNQVLREFRFSDVSNEMRKDVLIGYSDWDIFFVSGRKEGINKSFTEFASYINDSRQARILIKDNVCTLWHADGKEVFVK